MFLGVARASFTNRRLPITQPKVRSASQRFLSKTNPLVCSSRNTTCSGLTTNVHHPDREWLAAKPTIDPNCVQTRHGFAHLFNSFEYPDSQSDRQLLLLWQSLVVPNPRYRRSKIVCVHESIFTHQTRHPGSPLLHSWCFDCRWWRTLDSVLAPNPLSPTAADCHVFSPKFHLYASCANKCTLPHRGLPKMALLDLPHINFTRTTTRFRGWDRVE